GQGTDRRADGAVHGGHRSRDPARAGGVGLVARALAPAAGGVSRGQLYTPRPPWYLSAQEAPMRRSRLRAGLLVVVAIALAGIGYQVWRNVAERAPRSLAELGVELLPEVAQHIQTFHRVKVKNGRMVWEIKADDAQYYDKENSVVVRSPEVSVYT